MHIDDLRPLPIFDDLTDTQLEELLTGGEEVVFEPGTVPFREGDPAESWWVLVDGALELLRFIGRQQTVVARMDVPGRWAGGFQAWDEHGVYLATARGLVPGRLLRVPSEVLRGCTERWFPFGAHLIDGLYHTARSIESTARQHGSLVTLGTLAAGLAHELNNPAAAAARSVTALEGASSSVLTALQQLAENEITAAQFASLDALRREVVPESPDSDPLARADREDALADWLKRHGADRPHILAATLAGAGVELAWCEQVATTVPERAVRPALEWAGATFTVTELLGEVGEATRRISELVGAVRSYSQVDRATTQEIDLTEGIESTLVVLSHKLRDGVTVRRDYAADLPKVQAYPGELNQVWTNLVDNAVDAMAGEGTLVVSTRLDGDQVVVEVADDGAGMPPEVAARAFEAFYTTKDVGKGTGLGLDIAQRIVVERHAGAIEIDSRPGRTVLQVRLPLRL